MDARRRPHAVAALRDAWSRRVGLERCRGDRGADRSASSRCAALGRRRAAVNGPPLRHRRDACGVEPRLGCAGCRGMQSLAALLVKQTLSRAGIDGDVLLAPLRFCGDRCGSVDSIAPWYSLCSSFDSEGSKGARNDGSEGNSSRVKASCVARRSASSASEWSQGGAECSR